MTGMSKKEKLISKTSPLPRLSWNDSLTNFSWFYVQRSRLWLPELYLSDRVYARDNVDDHHISRLLAGVFSDGRIITYLTLRDLSRCPFNNYRFPFDEQLCKITVESRYFSEISYFDDEEYCASVYPELSLSSCKMEIDAITKSGDYYTQPAGWTVLFGANDSNHVVGQDYRHFRLRRKALTPFLIWILCPVSIASVAVIGIFYFWYVNVVILRKIQFPLQRFRREILLRRHHNRLPTSHDDQSQRQSANDTA